jgi:hypothetical protein
MVVGDKVRIDLKNTIESSIFSLEGERTYVCKDVNGKVRYLNIPREMRVYDNKEYTISKITSDNWIKLKDIAFWDWSPDWLVKVTNNVKELSW